MYKTVSDTISSECCLGPWNAACSTQILR